MIPELREVLERHGGIPRESGDDPRPNHRWQVLFLVFPARAGMILI